MKTCKYCGKESGYRICADCTWKRNEITLAESRKWDSDKRKVIAAGFKMDSKCAKCGSENNLTIDHIRPRSKGGSNELSNLQTLCKSCNSKKGTR